MSQPLKTFICYAREDRDAVDDLRKHLKQAEKKQMLEIWDDGEILAGQDWDKAIKVRLEKAQLILMLVSVDFINSDYIEKTELQAALQRHLDGEATLIPVIVRRCDWYEHFGIGQFQALPKEGRPIKSGDLSVREEVYYEVAQGIKKVAQEMQIKINLLIEQGAAEMAAKQAAEDAAARKGIKDEATWKATIKLNTLEAYENYLDEGHILHLEEAHQRIFNLAEIEAEQRVKQKAMEKPHKNQKEEKRPREVNLVENKNSVDIFIVYVSEDLRFKDELKKYLKPMLREGAINLWDDYDLDFVDQSDTVKKERLYKADIVMVMVSVDLLARKYFYGEEINILLDRHQKGESTVVPVILRICDWRSSALGSLQALPSNLEPVKRWLNSHEAWKDVTNSVRKLVKARQLKF